MSSAHSGSIFALTRAHSRDVSTSSAAITNCGGFLNRPEPGKIANLVPRAPRYWCWLAGSFMPRWDSRPDISETCTLCGSAGSPELSVTPIWDATWRSWAKMSCHSRMRR